MYCLVDQASHLVLPCTDTLQFPTLAEAMSRPQPSRHAMPNGSSTAGAPPLAPYYAPATAHKGSRGTRGHHSQLAPGTPAAAAASGQGSDAMTNLEAGRAGGCTAPHASGSGSRSKLESLHRKVLRSWPGMRPVGGSEPGAARMAAAAAGGGPQQPGSSLAPAPAPAADAGDADGAAAQQQQQQQRRRQREGPAGRRQMPGMVVGAGVGGRGGSGPRGAGSHAGPRGRATTGLRGRGRQGGAGFRQGGGEGSGAASVRPPGVVVSTMHLALALEFESLDGRRILASPQQLGGGGGGCKVGVEKRELELRE